MSTNDVGFLVIAKWTHLAWFMIAAIYLTIGMVEILAEGNLARHFRRNPATLHLKAIFGLIFLPEVLAYQIIELSFDDPFGRIMFWKKKRQLPTFYG